MAQPKRDPDDVRYWTQAEGGKGFNRSGTPRYRYSATREYSDTRQLIADHSLPSMDSPDLRLTDYSPDTIRARARALLLLTLERLREKVDDVDNPLAVTEITGIVNALGKVSGVSTIEVKQTGSVAHLHLDALRATPEAIAHALREATRANPLPRNTFTRIGATDGDASTRTGEDEEAPPSRGGDGCVVSGGSTAPLPRADVIGGDADGPWGDAMAGDPPSDSATA